MPRVDVVSRVRILNAEFDAFTREQTVDHLITAVRNKQRGWLCTVNVAILMMMRDNPALQHFIERAKWVVADGQPLIWAAPIFRGRLPQRVTGIELIDALVERAEKEGYRIYLLGAKQDIVDIVAVRLKQRYRDVNICGATDGYFTLEEATLRADAIRKSGAHILFVGMGVPNQEKFIEEQWERLGVNVAIGVGGSFDVIAGLRKRAPAFIQRIGMEWFFRLVQEPRRMWKRYLTTNTRFLYLISKAAISRTISIVGLSR